MHGGTRAATPCPVFFSPQNKHFHFFFWAEKEKRERDVKHRRLCTGVKRYSFCAPCHGLLGAQHKWHVRRAGLIIVLPASASSSITVALTTQETRCTVIKLLTSLLLLARAS